MRSFPLPAVAALLALLPAASFAQGAPPVKSPAAPAASSVPGVAAAQEEEIKIPGTTLARPDGRFLGVEMEGVTMKVTFYDKKKKKEAADVIRISARWRDGDQRFAVLLPAAPETLVSPGVMRRPFDYMVHLSLVGADEKVLETYSLRPQ